MAEKKKGWFSRLFGGGKKEEVPQEVSPVESPESVEEAPSAHESSPVEKHEPADTKIDSAVEESKVDEASEIIVEGIAEEIHETFSPHPTHHDESSHEKIKPQHHFLEDIASDAKAEMEARHHQEESKAEVQPEIVEEEMPAVEVIEPVETAEEIETTPEEAIAETTHTLIEETAVEVEPEVVEAEMPAVEAIEPVETAEEIEPTPEEVIVETAHALIEETAVEVESEVVAEKMPTIEGIEPVETAEEIETTPEEVIIETAHAHIEETAVEVESEIIEKEIPAVEAIEPAETAEEIEATPEEVIVETTPEIIEEVVEEIQPEVIEEAVPVEEPKKKKGFFARLSSKLSKTRNNLTEGLADLFLGKKEINEEILEELETRLLMADVGIKVTDQMLTSIRDSVSRKSLSNVDELFAALKVQMKEILEPVSKPLVVDTEIHKPYVILMIGVNGVGKTTTIGKLAKKFQAEGKSVMLAAGDTFRAAAVEQLEIWGERNKIPVISQKEGADPASVIFDAMESAKARKVDILIADTAGRLHTDSGLMQELGKINRVIKRHDDTAPHEVMLVVDASTGQNALNQARQFNETVPLSGMTFTKLDGTAKGGILFAIAEELEIPIRFIGVGESIDDLRPFNSDEFVDALVETKTEA